MLLLGMNLRFRGPCVV